MPVTVSFTPKTSSLVPASSGDATPPTRKAQAIGLQLISLRVKDAGSKTWRTVELSEAEKTRIINQCSTIFKEMSLTSDPGKSVTLRFSKKTPESPSIGKVATRWIANRPPEVPSLEIKTITYYSEGKIQTKTPGAEEVLKLRSIIDAIDAATQSIFKRSTEEEPKSPLRSGA